MNLQRLHVSVLIFLSIIFFGTLGYMVVEGMPLFDSLYMTVITISTVGFSEVRPLSPPGRAVTMLIIITSITIGGYAISMMARMLIEGELRRSFERRRMERLIRDLDNHIIICGYGRIGRIVCREMVAGNIDFVVIEQDPEAVAELEQAKYLYLQMDATTEEALIKAGIMNARGLVTAVRSDANNVFITLTAKGLREDIFVLSRSSDIRNEDKLKRAGASRVVSPYFIGGRRMAQVLQRPTVVDFIDLATMSNKLGLMIEEVTIGSASNLAGKNLVQSHVRQDFGVIIVGIKPASGPMVFNPTPTEVLNAGDVLVVLGKREDVIRMGEVL
jgi:voltage-gated potassium channel